MKCSFTCIYNDVLATYNDILPLYNEVLALYNGHDRQVDELNRSLTTSSENRRTNWDVLPQHTVMCSLINYVSLTTFKTTSEDD